jgi:hypothetical protein
MAKVKERGRAIEERPRIRLKAATRRLAPFRISHRRPSPWQPKERDEEERARKR